MTNSRREFVRLAALAGLAGAAGRGARAQAPSPELTAPAVYRVLFHTTNGNFTLEAQREWAPHGADHFYTLVKSGFYTGNAFYRVVPRFLVQWGLSPDPGLSQAWARAPIADDPVRQSNGVSMASFAARGPQSRTTQIFINLKPNPQLDKLGFAPFGRVITGMETVANLESEYGEIPPQGTGPDQRLIEEQGAKYLTKSFPRLDVIYSATVVE